MNLSTEETFPHPIGILLFNSPDYSEIVLRSFLSQDINVDPSRVVITVDGYINSKDEALGKNNQVDKVITIAKKYFPNSRIIHNDTNQGIAKQFQLLENELFNFPNSEWALFLEHDFELFPNYLRGINTIVNATNQFNEVVQVDCTGSTNTPLSRGNNSVYPANDQWAFALKKSHFIERKIIVSEYVDSISTSYYLRDLQKIKSTLKRHGVYPLYTSQDSVKRAIRNTMGKLAVTSGLHLGKYIGEEGEHSTPELFAKLGYQNWDFYIEQEFHITPREVEKVLTVLKHEELLSVRQKACFLVDNSNSEIVNLRNKYTQLESIHKNLESSISWRITAPLRKLNAAVTSLIKKS